MIQVSQKSLDAIAKLKQRYPDPKSSVMPLLYILQQERGFIDDDSINFIADEVKMSAIHVRELVTFYTMYYSEPVGKYHFQVCRTLSCALRGSKQICELLKEKFGIEAGEVSADGNWSFEQVECLGSCGTAPMCQINDTYFENLTPEILSGIIDRIEKEQPNLRFSTADDCLADGFKDLPKSRVM